ncbi:MAG: 3-hydroxyacyl-CoA dehydrogenase family protein [Thermoleophilia bacterium]|nr:3-hydroxyacyl-CoA dehydrogenase family protein [Thermoleophilia bacterium]
MHVRIITVVGAGTMGRGIAQVAAAAEYGVRLRDVETRTLERAMESVENSLLRMVKGQKITEGQMHSTLERILPTTDLATALEDADLVIEAVPEDLDLKKALWAEIEDNSPLRTIFASNTSQLSITSIASATKREERFIGMHWFSPPVLMRLVEIVRGMETSDETVETVRAVSERMGKETVVCKDSQGFITTRAFLALLNECFRIYDEGIASVEDIDKAIKLGLNHPMGPFQLADYTGVEVALEANKGLAEAFGDRFRSPQCLRQLVSSGNLGVKTGRGFYRYGASS